MQRRPRRGRSPVVRASPALRGSARQRRRGSLDGRTVRHRSRRRACAAATRRAGRARDAHRPHRRPLQRDRRRGATRALPPPVAPRVLALRRARVELALGAPARCARVGPLLILMKRAFFLILCSSSPVQ